jgi:hypothetical protein
VFAKLRKSTISFLISACLLVWSSVRKELGSHREDFHGILYLSIFGKSVEKIKVSLNSDNNNGYFT